VYEASNAIGTTNLLKLLIVEVKLLLYHFLLCVFIWFSQYSELRNILACTSLVVM